MKTIYYNYSVDANDYEYLTETNNPVQAFKLWAYTLYTDPVKRQFIDDYYLTSVVIDLTDKKTTYEKRFHIPGSSIIDSNKSELVITPEIVKQSSSISTSVASCEKYWDELTKSGALKDA